MAPIIPTGNFCGFSQTIQAKIWHYSDVYVEGLWKTMKSLYRSSRYLIRDSNQTPPEYEYRGIMLRRRARSFGLSLRLFSLC
jgi:hypothetical protein